MFSLRRSQFECWAMAVVICSFLFRLFSLGTVSLLVEEAYYWNYAAHLDWSYLDHPPMVALLIKISTFLWGTTEWAVRFPSLLCWVLTTFYSYRLTKICGARGEYAVFLLSVLPFFFLQSWVMTPDQPLLVAWSSLLYYLYRCCVLNESRAWYFSGLCLGFGLLSKYTIILLAPATFLFLLCSKKRRFWLRRVEPYAAFFIAILIFSPVLYWNAQHDWISFAFQSSRRLQEHAAFSLHLLLGLLILFLTPLGMIHLFKFCQKSPDKSSDTVLFLKYMFFFPLFFFTCFSLFHAVKFNWIGPSVLALIPWFSREFSRYQKAWLWSAFFLISGYAGLLTVIVTGQPVSVYLTLFNKYIDWQKWSENVFNELFRIEKMTQSAPYLVALDKYNIASEFAFYQQKLHPSHTYVLRGSDVFGGESLMYRYWGEPFSVEGRQLLLVTDNPLHFENPAIALHALAVSPVESWFAVNQGTGVAVRPYFYRVIQYG
jgi:4-amino-4-deoxy-L-arabinose transferase-like glycosyltransferase